VQVHALLVDDLQCLDQWLGLVSDQGNAGGGGVLGPGDAADPNPSFEERLAESFGRIARRVVKGKGVLALRVDSSQSW
jgi:hypothetical protein